MPTMQQQSDTTIPQHDASVVADEIPEVNPSTSQINRASILSLDSDILLHLASLLISKNDAISLAQVSRTYAPITQRRIWQSLDFSLDSIPVPPEDACKWTDAPKWWQRNGTIEAEVLRLKLLGAKMWNAQWAVVRGRENGGVNKWDMVEHLTISPVSALVGRIWGIMEAVAPFIKTLIIWEYAPCPPEYDEQDQKVFTYTLDRYISKQPLLFARLTHACVLHDLLETFDLVTILCDTRYAPSLTSLARWQPVEFGGDTNLLYLDIAGNVEYDYDDDDPECITVFHKLLLHSPKLIGLAIWSNFDYWTPDIRSSDTYMLGIAGELPALQFLTGETTTGELPNQRGFAALRHQAVACPASRLLYSYIVPSGGLELVIYAKLTWPGEGGIRQLANRPSLNTAQPLEAKRAKVFRDCPRLDRIKYIPEPKDDARVPLNQVWDEVRFNDVGDTMVTIASYRHGESELLYVRVVAVDAYWKSNTRSSKVALSDFEEAWLNPVQSSAYDTSSDEDNGDDDAGNGMMDRPGEQGTTDPVTGASLSDLSNDLGLGDTSGLKEESLGDSRSSDCVNESEDEDEADYDQHLTDLDGLVVPLEVIEKMRLVEGATEEEWAVRGFEVGAAAWQILMGWKGEQVADGMVDSADTGSSGSDGDIYSSLEEGDDANGTETESDGQVLDQATASED